MCFHGSNLLLRKTHFSPSHSSEEINPSEAMVIYLSVIATAVKSSIRSFCEIEVCSVGLRLGKAVGLVVCVGAGVGRINGFVVGIAEGAWVSFIEGEIVGGSVGAATGESEGETIGVSEGAYEGSVKDGAADGKLKDVIGNLFQNHAF